MEVKVSVIIIAYNQEDYIEQTIRSIANQKTNFDFEIIVGDDCSTDNTRNILLKLSKEIGNLKLLLHKKNKGIVENFMSVYNAAIGDYIASLGGDDYYLIDTKLQLQYNFLEKNKDYALCATSYKMYMMDTNSFVDQLFDEKDLLKKELWIKNPIAACTTMYRRSLIPTLDLEFKNVPVEDWILWNRFALLGKVRLLPDVTAVYRVHINSAFSSLEYPRRLIWRLKSREYIKEHISMESDKEFLMSIHKWDKTVFCSSVLKSQEKKRFYTDLKSHGYQPNFWVWLVLIIDVRLTRSLLWRILSRE